MANHFKWILTCIDDNTTYSLTKDPVGFDECVYSLERHSVYHGVFNQFTSNLKFHNSGGGKQFIDAKYQLFDINAQVNIQVLIDTNGLGLTYETLFNGKLNLASYQEDGLHTTVNIEQSDLATKLNTRADIPVPINVPIVNIPGQPSFKVVFIDSYQPQGAGVTHIFNDPSITKGKIFKVTTTDVNNIIVADSVTFNADHQAGPGGASGPTTIQITDIVDGSITVTFANPDSDITLLQVGSQLSLGQQVIKPVDTKRLTLNGIPILYQSEFKMAGNITSGTHTFTNSLIASGHTITIYTADINNKQISDQVVYSGVNTPGPGNISGNSKIQITNITAGQVIVSYISIYGDIQLWVDGEFVATFTPVTISSEQDYTYPAVLNTPLFYKGFIGFDTDTVFDNLNDFTWGTYNDVGHPGFGIGGAPVTGLPAILETLKQPYLKYPVTLNYKIRIKGKFKELLGHSLDRVISIGFDFIKGTDLTTGNYTILNHSSNGFAQTTLNTYQWDFDLTFTGTTTLNADEKLWFGAFFSCDFHDSMTGAFDIPFQFIFDESDLNFEIVENAKATDLTGIMIHEAFNQVADMIGDSDGNFYSDFYGRTNSQKRTYGSDGEGSKKVLTNGLCVRGKLDKYISTSLNELFSSMTAIDNIGMEIDANNRLRVEKLENFYDANTKIATLTNVYSFITLNSNPLYYNQIEIGYDKWETELYFKNGLDEVHGKRYFGTRIATAKGISSLQKFGSNIKSLVGVSNKLDKVCKFIAGNYAIELTRRKNYEWSTDDFKYDNDNFIICVRNEITVYAIFFTNMAGEPCVTLYGAFNNVQNSDTLIFTGTASNDGTYTVQATLITTEELTILTLDNAVTNETAPTCKVTDANNPFVETAGEILDPVNGNIINNINRPNLSGDWLNMAITPARMLQNNFNHISAALQKIKGNIQFLNGEANYLAQTKFKNDGITRQQDYSYYTLGENTSVSYGDGNVRNVEPLWLPEIYRFDYPLTYQQFKAIKANPNGYIEFYKFATEIKKGFLLSMEYNLKTGMTKFELLKVYDPAILLMETEDARLAAGEDNLLIETVSLKQ